MEAGVVCVCEREGGCLIGKQMNKVSWDGDEKETTTNVVSVGERVILVV